MAAEKPHSRPRRDGGNFLAFTRRHFPTPNSSRRGDKRRLNPSPDASRDVQRTLNGLGRKHVGSPTVALLNERQPVSKGWSTSFRMGVSKEGLNDLDRGMSRRAQRSMKRRHPMQSGGWRTEQYWGRTCGRQDRGVLQEKKRPGTLRQFAWTKIVRQRLGPTPYSPAAPPLQDSGRQRRAQSQGTACRRPPLVQRQQGICPVCHQPLENGEARPIHQGGPRKAGAETTVRICGSCSTTAIATFTAAVRLLGDVDGVRRVLGDGCARF